MMNIQLWSVWRLTGSVVPADTSKWDVYKPYTCMPKMRPDNVNGCYACVERQHGNDIETDMN